MNCAICGETLGQDEDDPEFMRLVEMGQIAEMYNKDTDESGIVHASCGLSKGWEVA